MKRVLPFVVLACLMLSAGASAHEQGSILVNYAVYLTSLREKAALGIGIDLREPDNTRGHYDFSLLNTISLAQSSCRVGSNIVVTVPQSLGSIHLYGSCGIHLTADQGLYLNEHPFMAIGASIGLGMRWKQLFVQFNCDGAMNSKNMLEYDGNSVLFGLWSDY